MRVIYIGHSGFYIEMERHAFLIDYYKGMIPDIPEEKQLYVLVSHAHSDHFNPDIFRLASRSHVSFLLSSDISLSRTPDAKCRFLEPGVREIFGEGSGAVSIRTLKSTDEGLAFDITCEGRRIYHAGDLNWWYWEEEGDEWNSWVEKAYQEQIAQLSDSIKKGEPWFTAAFLPLDPRQEDAFYLGFDYFMRNVGAAHAFPMHFWDRPEVIDRLEELPASLPYRDRIRKLGREGEEFIIA